MTFHFLPLALTVYFGLDSKLITLFLHVSKCFCISPSVIMNHYGPNLKLWASSKGQLQKSSLPIISISLLRLNTELYSHCPSLFTVTQLAYFSCTIWCVSPSLVLGHPDLLRGCNVCFLLFLCCSAEQTDPKEKSYFKLNLNDPPSS